MPEGEASDDRHVPTAEPLSEHLRHRPTRGVLDDAASVVVLLIGEMTNDESGSPTENAGPIKLRQETIDLSRRLPILLEKEDRTVGPYLCSGPDGGGEKGEIPTDNWGFNRRYWTIPSRRDRAVAFKSKFGLAEQSISETLFRSGSRVPGAPRQRRSVEGTDAGSVDQRDDRGGVAEADEGALASHERSRIDFVDDPLASIPSTTTEDCLNPVIVERMLNSFRAFAVGRSEDPLGLPRFVIVNL